MIADLVRRTVCGDSDLFGTPVEPQSTQSSQSFDFLYESQAGWAVQALNRCEYDPFETLIKRIARGVDTVCVELCLPRNSAVSAVSAVPRSPRINRGV